MFGKKRIVKPEERPTQVAPRPTAPPPITAPAILSVPVKRPADWPPADQVIAEYTTATHRIFKLKNHRKVAIPLATAKAPR
jgi:hypothetical protein